jgi:putative transposase
MTKNKSTDAINEIKELFAQDPKIRELLRGAVQAALEAEMTELLGVESGQRAEGRQGYRAGYYSRALITRVGKLELRVPRDRDGSFSTQIFERYQRAEKAFVLALAEMYVQGVSTRKVKAITEELCGHTFSASTISNYAKRLDLELELFAHRKLTESYPYIMLDARYEKVRVNGVIVTQAVLIALGINWDGRKEILSVELATRESENSWKQFLERLVDRGLHGVEFVVSDNHSGLKRAVREVFCHAVWQRCYVHFLRNAIDHLPRKADDDCLQELRWIYDRRDIHEAQRDLASWLTRWESKYSKLCRWVEENIEETLSFYHLPRAHHKHLKSTNLLERVNEEIKRRTRVVRIFPNQESCLRLIRAVTTEMHENWIEDSRYLNMAELTEHKKRRMQELANAA